MENFIFFNPVRKKIPYDNTWQLMKSFPWSYELWKIRRRKAKFCGIQLHWTMTSPICLTCFSNFKFAHAHKQNLKKPLLMRIQVNFAFFNPFHATDLFWYPLKTSENQTFCDVFRDYQKRSVAWNELTKILCMKNESYSERFRRDNVKFVSLKY